MNSLYLLFLCAMVSFGASAQDSLAVSDNIKSDAVVARLSRELDLNEHQRNGVYRIMQHRWITIRNTERRDARVNRVAVDDDTMNNLKKIFTRDQYKLFLELRNETRRQKQIFLSQNPGYQFSKEDEDLDF